MQTLTPSAKSIPRRTTSDYPPPSSHIESIPDETLIQVMQLTLPDSSLPRNTFSAALKLSHISRRFRLIAHNISELWTVIHPKYPLTHDQTQFWMDVLERSGARLIDIEINIKVGLGGAIQPYTTFLGAVVRHSNRWRKFKITTKMREPIDLFLDQSRHLCLLPGLEEITIRHSENSDRRADRDNEDCTPIFHNVLFGKDVLAPNLKVLKLGATYFDYSRMRSLAKDLIELNLENHTYLRTSYAPEMIIDMLRALPGLRILTFTDINIEFDNRPRAVKLQYLNRLKFRGFPQNAMHLLPLLHVPSLEVLDLGESRLAADLETVTIPPVPAADRTITRVLMSLFTSPAGRPWGWKPGRLRELSLEYNHCPCVREVRRVLSLTRNVERLHVSSPIIFTILADPDILPNLWYWVVKSPMFRDPYPFSDILTDRPEVTLFVEGDLTQDGERLYNTLKDTHKIALRT